MRQLEFRGLIQAQPRSGYVVANKDASIGRYQARGVSSDKTEVHKVVDKLDHGLFRHAFCKITEDFLTGNPDCCNVIHADGSGTKSILGYLAYKETGDKANALKMLQKSLTQGEFSDSKTAEQLVAELKR